MDLDEVADELYAVHPEEFIAVRKERQEQARADGDRALAGEIGALPKPSTAAWACNLLVRAQRAEIEGLVELGGLLREAQENLAGDQLRALNHQRAQLLSALTRQASSLARERGHPISTAVATQVEETLRAALADPEAGEAVLSGRLTSSLSYSGLGMGERPHLRVVPPLRRDRPVAPEKQPTARSQAADERRRTTAEERRQREQEAARRAEEARRRRELAAAEQALAEADAAVEEAEAAVEAEQVRVDELGTRQENLQIRVDELMDELTRTREECSTVAAQLSRAQRRRQAAGRRGAEAAAAREQARSRLAALRDGD